MVGIMPSTSMHPKPTMTLEVVLIMAKPAAGASDPSPVYADVFELGKKRVVPYHK